MAPSSTSRAQSSAQRFNHYLNVLQEEFGLQSNATSTKRLQPSRFSNYLGGLKREFDLISQELESLQKAWDGHKEKVEVQPKELEGFRGNFVCEQCKNGAPQNDTSSQAMRTISSVFSKDFFHSKLLSKLSTSRTSRGVYLTQDAPSRRSSQPIILTNDLKHYSTVTPTRLSQFVSGLSNSNRGSSITFNDNVKKELDVEPLHALSSGEPIFCVNFSQDGKRLAAGCRDGKAYVYDVQTGTVIRVLRDLLAEQDLVRALCFSRDGKYLATGSSNAKIYIWEINTRYVRNAFKGHTRRIRSLDFSPNGRLLVSASYDNTVRLWNMHDGATKVLAEDEPTFLDDPCYSSAVFSPDGRYVAASHRDGVVRIWDGRTGQLMRRVKMHMDRANAVAFLPDGKGLVSGGWDPALKYMDIGSLYDTQLRSRSQTMNDSQRGDAGPEEEIRHEQQFLGHKDAVRSLAISPDGRWIASGSVDHSVRIWDTRNAAMQCIFVHEDWIYSVDFSLAGGYLASGGLEGIVRIWKYLFVSSGS